MAVVQGHSKLSNNLLLQRENARSHMAWPATLFALAFHGRDRSRMTLIQITQDPQHADCIALCIQAAMLHKHVTCAAIF